MAHLASATLSKWASAPSLHSQFAFPVNVILAIAFINDFLVKLIIPQKRLVGWGPMVTTGLI